MSCLKEIVVVVIAANPSEEVQRVELAGEFNWHSVGEVRRAVARTVKCAPAAISLDQWNGEEWVVALQDPAAFKYCNNSFGAQALFRWERVTEDQEEDELLCVRRVVFRDEGRKGESCVEGRDGGLSCAMKVCRCEEKEVPVVADKNERVDAVEAEIAGMRGAMAELSLLVEKSMRVLSRQVEEKVTVSGSEGASDELGARGEEVPRLTGLTSSRYQRMEVLVRAPGVPVAAVIMAMRRSGMRVAGVSGREDIRGVRLCVRLVGQTERGWVQEWRGRVMKRNGVPWRVVLGTGEASAVMRK
jgi:hypothetical protein